MLVCVKVPPEMRTWLLLVRIPEAIAKHEIPEIRGRKQTGSRYSQVWRTWNRGDVTEEQREPCKVSDL